MRQLVLAHPEEGYFLKADLAALDKGEAVDIFMIETEHPERSPKGPVWKFTPEFNDSKSDYFGLTQDGCFALLKRNADSLFLYKPEQV